MKRYSRLIPRKALAISKLSVLAATTVTTVATTGCTGQLDNSFRFRQVEELFNLGDAFNTKVDILFVIDNSSSMNTAQDKLRAGLSSFASRYMQPTWDMRVGVITSDAFLAHPSFTNYINSTIAGTTGWQSPYILNLLPNYRNPDYNTGLINLVNATFPSGIRIRDQYPALGPDYAKLITGVADGPRPGLCSEQHPYFLNGAANCRIRDDYNNNSGNSKCLSPNTGGGETAITQCVNTAINNTVHSGKAIIETMPPSGTAGDAAWVQQITNQFMINVSVGSWGDGSERSLGSIQQFLTDNEATGSATAFFRQGSVRAFIIIGDEDDQTMTIPTPAPGGYTSNTGYTTTCSAKTVDGHTYTLARCPVAANLVAVSDIKTEIDTFFNNLDGSSVPNYFVAAIVPLTGSDIQTLQADRDVEDMAAVGYTQTATDRPDRILDLVNRVGNGSMSLSIASANYSPLLDSIGTAIARTRSTFHLQRAPTGQEDMIVTIYKTSNNSVVQLNAGQYTVNGTTLTITDVNFVLSLTASDRISINYQPRSVL